MNSVAFKRPCHASDEETSVPPLGRPDIPKETRLWQCEHAKVLALSLTSCRIQRQRRSKEEAGPTENSQPRSSKIGRDGIDGIILPPKRFPGKELVRALIRSFKRVVGRDSLRHRRALARRKLPRRLSIASFEEDILRSIPRHNDRELFMKNYRVDPDTGEFVLKATLDSIEDRRLETHQRLVVCGGSGQ
jgi:hypothetical protein